MKALVILAHPKIAESRVNSRLIGEVHKHSEITVHELYPSYPDWSIDVPREQDLLEKHDRIVFQFPLYWYSTPALLTEWLDLVWLHGFAYGAGGDALRERCIARARQFEAKNVCAGLEKFLREVAERK